MRDLAECLPHLQTLKFKCREPTMRDLLFIVGCAIMLLYLPFFLSPRKSSMMVELACRCVLVSRLIIYHLES